MNGPKATITRSKLTGFDIGHSHNHSSRSLHVNRRALSRSCCDIDNKSQHEDPGKYVIHRCTTRSNYFYRIVL